MAEEKPVMVDEKPEDPAEDFRRKMMECATPGMSVQSAYNLVSGCLEQELNLVQKIKSEVNQVLAPANKDVTPLIDINGGLETLEMAELRAHYDTAIRLLFAKLRIRMEDNYEKSEWKKMEELMLEKIRWGRVGYDKKFIPFREEGEAANIAVVDEVAWFGFGFPVKSGCQVFLSGQEGSKPLIMINPNLSTPFWAGIMMIRGLFFVEQIYKNPQVAHSTDLKERVSKTSLLYRWNLLNDYAGPALMEAYQRLFKQEKITSRNDVVRFLNGQKKNRSLQEIGRLFTEERPVSAMESEYRQTYNQYFLILAFITSKHRGRLEGEKLLEVQLAELAEMMARVNITRSKSVDKIYVGEKK